MRFGNEFLLQGLYLFEISHVNLILLSLKFQLYAVALKLELLDILVKLGLFFSGPFRLCCCFHDLHSKCLHLLEILSMLRLEQLLLFLEILQLLLAQSNPFRP